MEGWLDTGHSGRDLFYACEVLMSVAMSPQVRAFQVALLLLLLLVATASAQAQPFGPAIERIEPASGPPGTVVTVVGRRFEGGAKVWVGQLEAPVLSALPSRLKVKVPAAAITGQLIVQSRRGVARGPAFRVTEPPPAPVITGVVPAAAPAGSEVVISGLHFSPRLTGNMVEFAGQPVLVRTASPVALTVIVPARVGQGNFSVRVPPAGVVASSALFAVTAVTELAEFSPRRAGPGAELLLSGSGFSDKPADNRVYVGNRPAQVLAASAKQLRVRLPGKAVSGRILVDVKGAGRAESGSDFILQASPRVLGITPASARPGSYITVQGVHFGHEPAAVIARLGEWPMRVISAAGEELVLEVPDPLKGVKKQRQGDAQAVVKAPILVSVSGVGPATSSAPLTVLSPLRLSRFSPAQGPVGTLINLLGSGFAEQPHANRVTVGGAPAEVVAVGPGRLRARVSAGQSGPVQVSVAGESVRSDGPFVVTYPPTVSGLYPGKAEPGATIELRGKGFGARASLVRVSIGNLPVKVLSVQDDKLSVELPANARTGKITVTRSLLGSCESESDLVIVERLAIGRLEPASLKVGDLLTIHGSGFIAGQSTVLVGSVPLKPEAEGPEALQVRLPEGAVGGQVTVVLADGRKAVAPSPLQVVAQPQN